MPVPYPNALFPASSFRHSDLQVVSEPYKTPRDLNNSLFSLVSRAWPSCVHTINGANETSRLRSLTLISCSTSCIWLDRMAKDKGSKKDRKDKKRKRDKEDEEDYRKAKAERLVSAFIKQESC